MRLTEQMKRNIRNLAYFLICIFVVLILYLTYIVVQEGDTLARHPQNYRIVAREANIVRGTIYDRMGVKLAQTEWQGENLVRKYRVNGDVSPFAHIIGYVSPKYGSSGLEASYGKELLGLTDEDALKNLLDKILNRQPRGNDLVLTLDAKLQDVALKALKGRAGSVVAINPQTGEILAMISSPSYNPNTVTNPAIWSQLNKNEEDAPLLNRATQGAYAPGSVIKIVTGSGILRDQDVQPTGTIQCPGYVVVDGNKIEDNRAHGLVDFKKALALSCNTYFAQKGTALGWKGFSEVFEKFGLNQSPKLGVPVRPGTFAVKERQNQSQLAESAFGQGDTLISPLHMAMACSAIANNGVIMQPYLVKEIRRYGSDKPIRVTATSPWLTATDPETAAVIRDAMVSAAEWGTASSASLPGVKMAGKTGTAETMTDQEPNSLPHAWFVGFAPATDPQIAVAVIVEKSGSGSRIAAPIAKEVIAAALQRS